MGKENQAIRVPNGGQSLRDFLDLKSEDSQPLVIFDLKGHHEFKQTVMSNEHRIKELKEMESTLKETAKFNTEKLRKKMIQEGEKNLEKRRAEIETYKLKV